VNEMYPVYNNAAEFQGEKEAVRTTHYALEAEKIHAGMYTKALDWLNKVRIMMPTRSSFAPFVAIPLKVKLQTDARFVAHQRRNSQSSVCKGNNRFHWNQWLQLWPLERNVYPDNMKGSRCSPFMLQSSTVWR